MDDILIKPVKKKWASPQEFNTEQPITIVNFEKMTKEQITERDGRAPLYPPKGTPSAPVGGQDGFVRRLTFTQKDFDGERTLDVNSPRFEDDLSHYGIRRGDRGYLHRAPIEGRKAFRWIWKAYQPQLPTNENLSQ